MKAFLRAGLLAVLAAGFISGLVVAQTNSANLPAQNPPAPVTITFFADDGHGNPIRGLDQSDLTILDGGKWPQSITEFRSAKELPLRIGKVIENGLPWWEHRLDSPGWSRNQHLEKSGAYEDATKAALDFPTPSTQPTR